MQSVTSGHHLHDLYLEVEHESQEVIDAHLKTDIKDAEEFYIDSEVMVFMGLITWFYPVRMLLEVLFSFKAKRPFRLFTI